MKQKPCGKCGKTHSTTTLDPSRSDFDLRFLSDPSRWGVDDWGRRRCHVKTRHPHLSDKQFGIVYEMEPTAVYEIGRPGRALTWEKLCFNSLEELVKDWIVD